MPISEIIPCKINPKDLKVLDDFWEIIDTVKKITKNSINNIKFNWRKLNKSIAV